MPQAFGLVIRRDGTIPFDKQEDGSEHPHKHAILAEVARLGHDLDHHATCDHHKGHACSCEPKIKNWNPNGHPA